MPSVSSGDVAVEVPQSLPGCGKLRVVGAPGDGVGGGFHVVDGQRVEVAIGLVGRRRQDGVRVVVDRLLSVNVGGDLGIDGAFDGVLRRQRRHQQKSEAEEKSHESDVSTKASAP